MTSPELALAERIRDQIADLDRSVARASAAWERGKVAVDQDYYLDAVALNLHGFYSGVEYLCHQPRAQQDARITGTIAASLGDVAR